MPVAVIRHHIEDDPALLRPAFEAAGLDVEVHDALKTGWPPVEGLDAAVVLGSVWSVYDRDAVGDWIDTELDWLRALDAAGVPALGVCFGAQAMAAAFGGAVERAPRPEYGWVELAAEHPDLRGPWVQYHGDRCVVPGGAELLAANDIGPQAWRIRRNVAVQFHPEVDVAQLRRWIDGDGGAERERLAGVGVDAAAWLERTEREEPAAAERAAAVVRLVLGGIPGGDVGEG